MPDYLPEDYESCGNAVLMEWTNPDYTPKDGTPVTKSTVRLCVVQYEMRKVRKFDEFAQQCEYFVDTASDYRCDFVVFPELITTQLLSIVKQERPEAHGAQARRAIPTRYLDFFTDLAIRYNVNIIGGSHLTLEDDRLYNIAYLFRRDGTIGKQYKLHITPAEARWWGVSPGDKLQVFDTDCGKIAILVCYDIEFPELARVVTEKGAVDHLRALQHRHAVGPPARQPLRPCPLHREPLLCGGGRRDGQPAERRRAPTSTTPSPASIRRPISPSTATASRRNARRMWKWS